MGVEVGVLGRGNVEDRRPEAAAAKDVTRSLRRTRFSGSLIFFLCYLQFRNRSVCVCVITTAPTTRW